MIRSIIFDMGGVLCDWNPAGLIQNVGDSDADRELLVREIYYSVDWPMLDLGLLREKDLLEKVCSRIPARLHGAAEQLIFNWDRYAEPIPGMADLVRELKEVGYGIYLLSNASLRHSEYWVRIPGHEYFDGLVVSSNEHRLKPDLALYRILLDRFGLDPKECVFMDDVNLNVAGALACGIDGFLFRGADNAREELRRRGVAI